MTTFLLKHCALSYLNQWHRTDSRHMTAMAAGSASSSKGEAIRDLAAKYMVARCFSTAEIKLSKGKSGVSQFWEKVAQVACEPRLRANASQAVIAGEVHRLAESLGSLQVAKGSNRSDPTLLSAASKFLWFRGFHAVRIYDKRAVEALNCVGRTRTNGKGKWRVDRDYLAFSRAWQDEFDTRKPVLDEALEDLPAQLNWSLVPPAEYARAKKALDAPWFRDRVFDKYLWITGEAKAGGASAFV